MRFSMQKRAAALLLLVCGQYVFAASASMTSAQCLGASCLPKVTPAQMGKVTKSCPTGFTLTTRNGKDACTRTVRAACPAGTTLKNGKCCSSGLAYECGGNGRNCPTGTQAKKVCDSFTGTAALMTGRSLQSVKKSAPSININGKVSKPLLILPEPAISIDLKMPAKAGPTKVKNIPTMSLIPNIILPEADTIINMPLDKQDKGGNINIVGSFKDKEMVIPILPEPKFILDVPELPKGPVLPKINFNIEKVPVTVDLSKLGPGKKVNLEMEVPDFSKMDKKPSVEWNVEGEAPTIDLTGMKKVSTTKTVINVAPLQKPAKPNLTIELPNKDNKQEVKFLDLTGMGGLGKDGKQTVIKLPHFNVPSMDQKDININLGGKDVKPKTIVVPGKGVTEVVNVKLPTMVKVPDVDKKLTVTVKKDKSGPTLANTLAKVQKQAAAMKDTKVVNVTMPDLSMGMGKPTNIKVTIPGAAKPKLNLTSTKPNVAKPKTTQTVSFGNITLGGAAKKDVDINLALLDKLPKLTVNEAALARLGNTGKAGPVTTRNVDLSGLMKPITLPAMQGGEALIQVPMGKFGSVEIKYTEKVSGASMLLPNPVLAVAQAGAGMIDAVTSASCPTKCCRDKEMDSCSDRPTRVETAPVVYTCPTGCTLTASNTCQCRARQVAACPAGKTRCTLSKVATCVDSKLGCNPFVAACAAIKLTAC
jgi:hypothetical protein